MGDYLTVLRWGIGLGVLAVALESFAFALLSMGPLEGNSHLWFPLNACYFGGVIVAFVAAAFGLVGIASSKRTAPGALPVALAVGAGLLFRLAPYR